MVRTMEKPMNDKTTEGKGGGPDRPDFPVGTTCWRVGSLGSDPEPYLSLYKVTEIDDATSVVTLIDVTDGETISAEARFVHHEVVDEPFGRFFLTRRAALESIRAFAEWKRGYAKQLEDEADVLEEYVERTLWELVG